MSWLRTGCLLSRSGGTSFTCASSCAVGTSSTIARGAIESLPWHQRMVAQTTTTAGARSSFSSLAPTPSPVSPAKSVGNVCRPSRDLGHSSQTSLRSVESPRRRVRPWEVRHLSTTRQVSGESSSQDCHDDDEVPLQLSAEERQLVSTANAPPLILESTSHDPIFNLSYEDYLFRHVTPAERPILFMYRNHPAVVIGRNQVPWKEVDPERLESEGVRLVRRRSGGGAVYHDLGNTNFSILLPRKLFDRSLGAEMVARAIRCGMGIRRATVNERGDVVLKAGEEGAGEGWKKISGSAYKIVSQRAYHHGTMLINSDVSKLGRFLQARSPAIVAKGVDSVRSPVSTLASVDPRATHATFVQSVADGFLALFGDAQKLPAEVHRLSEHEAFSDPQRAKILRQGMEELQSWEWTYGQTPEFKHDLDLDMGGGRRISCDIEGYPELSKSLVGQRYDDLQLVEGLRGNTSARGVLHRLRAAL